MRSLLFLIIGSLFLFWFTVFYWQHQRRKAYILLGVGSTMLLLAAIGFFELT